MSSKRFELLVFDWDGTLMDSAGHIVASLQAAFAISGFPCRRDQARAMSSASGCTMR